jgi:CBS domain-containing protein
MSHLVYTLDARADIARAAALMAYEHVHQIVITHEDGRPLGLVSALDILGWIARASGYVIAPSELA